MTTISVNCSCDVSFDELAEIEQTRHDREWALMRAYHRLLAAGDTYTRCTGHRAPIWLGTIHHRVLRNFAYNIGYNQGRKELADELLERCCTVGETET